MNSLTRPGLEETSGITQRTRRQEHDGTRPASDWEIPNCRAIRDGVTPAFVVLRSRTMISFPCRSGFSVIFADQGAINWNVRFALENGHPVKHCGTVITFGAAPPCPMYRCAQMSWLRISGLVRARGAKIYSVRCVTGGARFRRICPDTWRSPDRRNCRDGTAPSHSLALQGCARQSIPAPDRYSTRHDWASPSGGSKNPRPIRR